MSSRPERLRTQASGRLSVHAVALCGPDEHGAFVTLASDTYTSTGAHIVVDAQSSGSTVTVPCVTLDRLLSDVHEAEDRVLVKLDLQGYELRALRGATALLAASDIVLLEVSFYAQAREPRISEFVAFLAEHSFELYDVATLYGRPRDDRPRQGDFIFCRNSSAIATDTAWS